MPLLEDAAGVPWLLLGFLVTQASLFLFYYQRPMWRRYRLRSPTLYVFEAALVLVVATAAFAFIDSREELAFVIGLTAPAVAGGATTLFRASEDARTLGYIQGLAQGEEVLAVFRERLHDVRRVDRAAVETLVDQATVGLEKAREEAERHLEET